MSHLYNTTVTCPKCQNSWPESLFLSLHAPRLPAKVHEILSGDFERITCTSCTHTFQPEHRMLYADPPQGLWVVMLPTQHNHNELKELEALEAQITQILTTQIQAAPDFMEDIKERARPRMVFGQAQLTEALQISHHQLSPEMVECMKMTLFRHHMATLMPLGPTTMRFIGTDPETHDLLFQILRRADNALLGTLRGSRAILATLEAQEEHLKTSYPELFARPFINATRYTQS